MKKLYYFLILFPVLAQAQITTPIAKANFGVDADLRANYINSMANGAGDDWFVNSAGTGVGVIDTSGAAALLAGYAANVANRRLSFSKLMLQDPYAIQNNRLLIDAIYHRDYHGSDSTIFAGGNKNGVSPALWNCPVAQSVPDKNEILDAMTHVRRAGPNITDSLWMFGGISIENTTGNRFFDFELYQTDIYYDRTTRKFMNYGPDAGHTSWTFDASGNIVTPGDIAFSAEYSSSALTLVEARIWVHKNALLMTPAQFAWGGAFDGDGSGATYGYASIKPKTAGAFYTGLQSAAGVWAGPFSLVLGDNSVTTSYTARQYMEFSVNMSKLGLDPAAYSTNPCGSPFRRVLIKSRSATAFSSELKDFIAPFRMFDYANVDAFADVLYFCGTMPSTPVRVFDPNAASQYAWSTINGSIVGSTTGTSITVNAPGTYYVDQRLHSSCPVYSRDSVTILFEPVCIVLDLQIQDFNAVKTPNNISLTWHLKNNQYAKSIQIEYSTDGINFNAVGSVDGNGHTGDASYSHRHEGYNRNARMLYYRIRVVDEYVQARYSRIANISNKTTSFQVYPNPTKGKVFIKSDSQITGYTVSDALGKCVLKGNATVAQTISLNENNLLSPGIYYIRLTTTSATTTHKFIIE